METFLTVIFYTVLMLFVFGVMVLLHEAGHYFVARRCKIEIKEFSVGMGPKLLQKKSKKYDTVYSLRLLPIGGYVNMVGEDEESECENAFYKKPVWQRMLVTAAGPFMNILLGILLTLIVVLSQSSLGSTIISKFDDNAVSSEKLAIGDEIVKIDGTYVFTGNEVLYEIMNKGYQPIDISVKRNGEEIVLNDVSFNVTVEDGVPLGDMDFKVAPEEKTFISVIKQTAARSVSAVKMVYDALIGLFSGRFGMNAISGPVGVAQTVGDAAKSDIISFLYIGSILTMNLGVFNFIPFPALDGGRFLFLCIEAVRRKPMKKEIEGYINFVGLMILFGLMIFITCKDIFKLFG